MYVVQSWYVLGDHADPQRSNDLDGLMEVFISRDCDQIALIASRIGHEQIPILVITPRFDCVNIPSLYGLCMVGQHCPSVKQTSYRAGNPITKSVVEELS